ncbi:sorting nexin-14-like isoform X2 [Gigantopelta aegis]|uniref:sorting nexin-14-like isoform X2 n=1 Tax=Gigantopelta aegis TaxID=1735272 RepID=UPI001B88C1F2|nr:sorting nexin-14-like isoform X2 [Gigantopelta aegis]
MIPWYIVKHYAHKHSKFTTGTAVLLLCTVVFYSYVKVFLFMWAFILGMAISYILVSPTTLVPNLLPMYRRKKKSSVLDNELTLLKSICTVCGQRRCPRHRPELNILAFQPWTNLEIRQRVDQALDEFFSIVLKDFVYTWYKDLSTDEEFVDELRTNFRFLAAVFLRRAKKLDIPSLITQKLVKATIQHLDCCIWAKNKAPPGTDIQQAVFDYLGPNVHCAMWSRKAELEYLRRVVEQLFPYLLRPQALHSKSSCSLLREILSGSLLLPAMDAVANPDMINNLILIFLDNTPPPEPTEPPSPMVPFLGHFSQPLSHNKSCLRLELKDVINKDAPELLYPFMQFLKSEAAVNVLQFCLACDDFNQRILSPNVSQSEFVELHNMAKELYRSYCAETALDRIKFDEPIVAELKDIIESPPDQIIRLRTSTPLFKAYEHAYDLLENNFLPLFHQSDDYYKMVCGDRPLGLLTRQTSKLPKKKEFAFSNLGSKLRDVFKSTDDKTGLSLDVTEDDLPASLGMVGSVDDEDEDLDGDPSSPVHNLSTWRVTIPMIGARPDPENIKRQFFVFIIEVDRADMLEGDGDKSHWTVARRYTEFYVLEQKLTEFHGDILDCQLPSKKSFGTKNQDFIEGKKEIFEQYLQKLLTKPHLKGSQLLFRFLTSQDEFTTSFLPDINLGKIVKSMPMKLVKEKGQHLDPFLLAFMTSTEAPKPRPGRMERRGSDASQRSTSSEMMSTTIYENNAGCGFGGPEAKVEISTNTSEVEGPFDSLVYVARYVYKIPDWFHHILMTVKMIAKMTVESYLEWYLSLRLQQVTQEHRLVALIQLLRDILFFDTDPPRTDEEKKTRYEEALQGCLDYIPKAFVSVVGSENHQVGTRYLLNLLQQPKLNKQLFYVLFDIVIQELFPELRETGSPSPS